MESSKISTTLINSSHSDLLAKLVSNVKVGFLVIFIFFIDENEKNGVYIEKYDESNCDKGGLCK